MTDTVNFETLYERFRPLVRRRLQSLLARYPDEIEDALQDTFVKVWRSLAKIEPDSQVQAWILRIATNTALDVVRARKRKPCQSLDLVSRNEHNSEQTLADMLPDSVDCFQAVELQETLAYLRRHLPIHYLNALALSMQGYNVNEIANRFHMSNGAVKNLLHRAHSAAWTAAQQQTA
jgi:RNA polymerase sigma-70 factor (ECF subfamily)